MAGRWSSPSQSAETDGSAWGYGEQNPHQDAQRRNPEWILSGHRRILRYKIEEYIADENRYVTWEPAAPSSHNGKLSRKQCFDRLHLIWYRSPIFALGSLGVGNHPAAKLPIGFLGHPVFVMTGLRVTEVPFVKYRTIELFCCQRTYRKSSEIRLPKMSL